MSTAFIYSFKESNWKSCQVITRNLIETYNIALKNQKTLHFNYNDEMTSYEILNRAEEIFKSKIRTLVIVDHKPHVGPLIRFLDSFYLENKTAVRPQVILHVFGDFTLFGEQWLKLEPFLKKFEVKFVCASDNQKRLVAKFLKNKDIGLFKMPFPVNMNDFYYSEKIRNVQREKNQIAGNQVVFLYTGRMSLQKKVIELAVDFNHFLKITNSNAVLYLAGEFDDLGNPFTGIFYQNGEYCQKYINILESLDPEYHKNIKYLGNLNKEELLQYYNMADCYISMSTHNDEDYGMSPAEAICTGLPSILTDWAGYSSFKIGDTNGCTLVPTKINTENNSIAYARPALFKSLIKNVEVIKSFQLNREKISKINSDNFSISGNVVVLKEILNSKPEKFKGFTLYMTELAAVFRKKTPPFSIYKTVTTINYNKLYTKLYDSYLSK